MLIRSLQQRADDLAWRAEQLRLQRNSRAERCLAIVRRRVGSPVGLAVSFSAGVVAGSRMKSRNSRPNSHTDTGGDSFARLLHGPVGTAAIKLASAFIAGSLLKPDDPLSTAAEPGE